MTENKTTTIEKKYEKTGTVVDRQGEKFKELCDKYHLAKGNLRNVDTWLFEMLAQSDYAEDYIYVVKFLLYKYERFAWDGSHFLLNSKYDDISLNFIILFITLTVLMR